MKKFSLLLAAVALFATACNKGGGEGNDGEKLATPVLTTSAITSYGFTVAWNAVENAGSYKFTVNGGAETTLYESPYNFTAGQPDTEYTFRLKAVAASSKYSDSDWAEVTVKTTDTQGGTSGIKDPESLKNGSNFYLIALDDASYQQISSKVVADFRARDIWCWESGDAYPGITPTGTNWRGNTEEWFAVGININAMGWFGIGWCLTVNSDKAPFATIIPKLADIEKDYQNYYLHLAMKAQHDGVYRITLNPDKSPVWNGDANQNESDARFDLGAKSQFNFTRDGEWHEVEIPMSYFFERGLDYAGAEGQAKLLNGDNIFVITGAGSADGPSPTSVEIDAIYIYKK